ncbi:MAG TPA: hypothetical protein VFD59_20435 [Nocardioidaceae bacterium]|nr:hypothetical protein [Nocardioidaceae bacterium]
MSKLKDSYERGELSDLLVGAEPPTAEDVSVTEDGRLLDSAEVVIEFFDEMRAARSQRPDVA